eukprot:Hpha_TRINITY_DN33686_c0_g1::TRINITY_DN33686_c0_g1_i1::g.43177::m.43177
MSRRRASTVHSVSDEDFDRIFSQLLLEIREKETASSEAKEVGEQWKQLVAILNQKKEDFGEALRESEEELAEAKKQQEELLKERNESLSKAREAEFERRRLEIERAQRNENTVEMEKQLRENEDRVQDLELLTQQQKKELEAEENIRFYTVSLVKDKFTELCSVAKQRHKPNKVTALRLGELVLKNSSMAQLRCSPPVIDERANGEYEVVFVGPLQIFQGTEVLPTGLLAPFTNISLTPSRREKLQIPESAAKFTWLYPLDKADAVAAKLQGEEQSPEVNLVTTGGFVYIDRDEKVVSVSSVEPAPVGTTPDSGAVKFRGPFVWDKQLTKALWDRSRFHPVTIQALRDIGVKFFCWVVPDEKLELDIELAPDRSMGGDQAHVRQLGGDGAFVYLFGDAHQGRSQPPMPSECDCYFAVDGGMTMVEKLEQQRWQRRETEGDALDEDSQVKVVEELKEVTQVMASLQDVLQQRDIEQADADAETHNVLRSGRAKGHWKDLREKLLIRCVENRLNAEISERDKQIEEKDAAIAELQNKLDETEEGLSRQGEELDDTAQDLQATTDELAAAKGKLDKLTADITHRMTTQREAEEERDLLEKEVNDLNTKVQMLESQHRNDLHIRDDRLVALENEITEREQKHSQEMEEERAFALRREEELGTRESIAKQQAEREENDRKQLQRRLKELEGQLEARTRDLEEEKRNVAAEETRRKEDARQAEDREQALEARLDEVQRRAQQTEEEFLEREEQQRQEMEDACRRAKDSEESREVTAKLEEARQTIRELQRRVDELQLDLEKEVSRVLLQKEKSERDLEAYKIEQEEDGLMKMEDLARAQQRYEDAEKELDAEMLSSRETAERHGLEIQRWRGLLREAQSEAQNAAESLRAEIARRVAAVERASKAETSAAVSAEHDKNLREIERLEDLVRHLREEDERRKQEVAQLNRTLRAEGAEEQRAAQERESELRRERNRLQMDLEREKQKGRDLDLLQQQHQRLNEAMVSLREEGRRGLEEAREYFQTELQREKELTRRADQLRLAEEGKSQGLAADVLRLEARIKHMQEEEKNTHNEIQNRATENERLMTSLREDETGKRRQLVSQVQDLQEELRQLQAAESVNARKIDQERVQLRVATDTAEQKARQQEDRAAAALRREEEVHQELESLRARASTAEDERRASRRAVESVKAELQESQDKERTARDEAEKAKQNAAAADEAANSVGELLIDAERQIEDLRVEASEAVRRMKVAQTRAQASDEAAEGLETRMNVLEEAAATERKATAAERQRYEKAAEQQQAEERALREEAERARNQMRQAQEREAAATSALRECEEAMRAALDDRERELRTLQQRFSQLESASADARWRNMEDTRATEARLDETRDEADRALARATAAESRLTLLQEQLETSTAALARAQQDAADHRERSRVQRVNTETLRAELEQVKQEGDSAQSAREAQAKRQVEEAQQQAAEAERLAEQERSRATTLDKDLQLLRDTARQQQERQAKEVQNYEEKVAEVRSRVEKHRSELRQKHAELLDARKQLSKNEERNRELDAHLAERRSAEDKLKQEILKVLDRQRIAEQEAEAARSKLEQEAVAAREELAATKEHAERWRQEATANAQRAAESEARLNSHEERARSLERAAATSERLREEAEVDAEGAEREMSEAHETAMESLRREEQAKRVLQEARMEAEEARERGRDSEDRAARLQKHLDEAKAAMRAAEDRLSTAQQRNADLERRLDQERDSTNRQRAEYDDALHRCGDAETGADHYRREAAEARQQLATARTAQEQSLQEARDLRLRTDSLEAALSRAEQDLAQSRRDVQKGQLDLEAASMRQQSGEVHAQQLQREQEDVVARELELRRELAKERRETERVQRELTELNDEVRRRERLSTTAEKTAEEAHQRALQMGVDEVARLEEETRSRLEDKEAERQRDHLHLTRELERLTQERDDLHRRLQADFDEREARLQSELAAERSQRLAAEGAAHQGAVTSDQLQLHTQEREAELSRALARETDLSDQVGDLEAQLRAAIVREAAAERRADQERQASRDLRSKMRQQSYSTALSQQEDGEQQRREAVESQLQRQVDSQRRQIAADREMAKEAEAALKAQLRALRQREVSLEQQLREARRSVTAAQTEAADRGREEGRETVRALNRLGQDLEQRASRTREIRDQSEGRLFGDLGQFGQDIKSLNSRCEEVVSVITQLPPEGSPRRSPRSDLPSPPRAPRRRADPSAGVER